MSFSEIFNELRDQANAYAQQYGIPSGPNPGENDAWNAFQHAYVSAILARDFSIFVAQPAGVYWEYLGTFGGYGQPESQALMDVWNDRVGWDVADKLGRDATNDEIASKIFEEYMSGNLITEPVTDNLGYMDALSDSDFWNSFLNYAKNPGSIYPAVWDYWNKSGTLLPKKDPLALDLDGNGISTLSANEGITFDHSKSGVEYGTGWINPADGWLALDRNGNGTIDSGRELFGDNTIKLDGNRALHAYDALASFDTNKDGKIDVADATGDTDSSGVIDGTETYWDMNRDGDFDTGTDKTFADLRVWVDANSNGNTDSGELKTLAELNIVSIATGKTTGSGIDVSSNDNTFKGNYTTTSGVVTDGTRSFNLVENKFRRVLSGGPSIPPDVALLPNMQGSGAVRDLHEAMSLGTAESAALKTTVQAFNSAATRETQHVLVYAA